MKRIQAVTQRYRRVIDRIFRGAYRAPAFARTARARFAIGALLLATAATADESLLTAIDAVQPVSPDALRFESRSEVRHADHADVRSAIDRALQRARKRSAGVIDGGLRTESESELVLAWPVRETISFPGNSVQAISNYFDQNAFSGMVRDFSCAEQDAARTYDGHRGVDIYLSPYSWYLMEQDAGIVIAAAPGVILEKVADQPERSCDIDGLIGDNNLIVIEHDDGSQGVYAHMRTGSLTARPIGSRVEAGEYLGVIGSSGNSTGPHLHFEIGYWENGGWNAIDPFKGACGDGDERIRWAQQRGYFDPAVLSVASHRAPPEFPACPQTERPNYRTLFSNNDTVHLVVAVRDLRRGDRVALQVRQPDGVVFSEREFVENSVDHYSGAYVRFSLRLPASAMTGAWDYTFSFAGQQGSGRFFVNADPPAPPQLPVADNAFNGLWYDPALDGEGYNIITTPSGTVIFFYGSDRNGERLWLLSELITEPLQAGQDMTIAMLESTGGTFAEPISSARGLSSWGELTLRFDDCGKGDAELSGLDGQKRSELVKLVGVPGTGCGQGAPVEASRYAGLWYDPALEGEGFNLVATRAGLVIYYYGFAPDGERLWLLTAPFELDDQVITELYRAPGGRFDRPQAPPLDPWGSLTVEPLGCDRLDLTLGTPDGLKSTRSVRLSSVNGLACQDD